MVLARRWLFSLSANYLMISWCSVVFDSARWCSMSCDGDRFASVCKVVDGDAFSCCAPLVGCFSHCSPMVCENFLSSEKVPGPGSPNMTVWPSGLRRWLKAPFRKGVGSNPTAVICIDLSYIGRKDNRKSKQIK